jgi:hypothetical protein
MMFRRLLRTGLLGLVALTFGSAAQSAISFVGQTTASAATGSTPAHLMGDLLLVNAVRGASTTAPTLPNGWISVLTKSNSTATTVVNRIGYRIATGIGAITSASQNTSTGVWTTAANSLVAGQAVQITGSLPGGYAANTNYYVIATGLSSTTVELSATQGGAVKLPTTSVSTTMDTDPVGTWTNANELVIQVYRPSSGATLGVGSSASSSSTTATVTYPALTLADTSGNSWVVGFVGASNTTQTLTAAATGMTNRGAVTGASYSGAGSDTNGGVSSWAAATANVTGSGSTVSATVEVVLLSETNSLSSNLYQYVAGGSNPYDRFNTGNNFTLPLPKLTGTGNTGILFITYDGGATVPTVTGAINGSFGAAAKTALGGAGNLDSAVYVKQNLTGGQETLTVSGFYPTIGATSTVNGNYYTITTLGTSDFTAIGAAATAAGNFQTGTSYSIKTVGTTNFTSIGASSNTVGVVFTATGAGTGSGTATGVGTAFQATGVGSGTGTVTQGTHAFTYSYVELNNVATSGGLQGSSSSAFSTTSAAGSFTPTNNNGTGGNVILGYFAKSDQVPGQLTSSIVPSAGLSLLGADIGWLSAPDALPKAFEGGVQATSAAINPAIASVNDSGDHWNSIALALRVSTGSGSSSPNSIQMNGISHFASTHFITTGIYTLQVPATGNLHVCNTTDPNVNTQLVWDSEGITWLADTAGAHFWYRPVAITDPNLRVYLQGGGSDAILSWRCEDINGAATSPYDSAILNGQSVSGVTSFTASPAPSPSGSSDLVIANVELGQGPGLGTTAPTGAYWDLANYVGETDLDLMENADIMSHYVSSASGAQTWTFSITAIASNSTDGGFIYFKAAPPAVVPASQFFLGAVGHRFPYLCTANDDAYDFKLLANH